MVLSKSEIVILALGALMWVVGLVVSRRRRKVSSKPSRGVAVSSSSMTGLVRACLGDQHQAYRLVEYEQERAPGITAVEAATRALERLNDDRTRG